MTERKTHSAIDVFKIICALLIVAIHVRPFASVSKVLDFYVVDVAARLAVPFFYAATAYFFFGSLAFSEDGTVLCCRENHGRLAKYIGRILMLYAVWSVIHLLWQIPNWYSIGWKGIPAVVDYVVIFFLKGSVYYFWYFVSLIYGAIALYVLLLAANIKTACCLAALLYLVKCAVYGYTWTGIPLLDRLSGIWNALSGPLDGVCLTLPFMTVGVLAARKVEVYRYALRHWKLGMIISLLCLAAEASFLFFFGGNTGMYSYIVFTLPVCLFLFAFVAERTVGCLGRISGFTLRKFSTVLFCVHPLVIQLCGLNEVYRALGNPAKYVVVLIVSSVLAVGAVMLRKRWRVMAYLM